MEEFEKRLSRGETRLHASSMRVIKEDGELLVAYFSYGHKKEVSEMGGKKKRKRAKRTEEMVMVSILGVDGAVISHITCLEVDDDDEMVLEDLREKRVWHGLDVSGVVPFEMECSHRSSRRSQFE